MEFRGRQTGCSNTLVIRFKSWMYKNYQLPSSSVPAGSSRHWRITYLFLEQCEHLPDISSIQPSLVLHLLQRRPAVEVFGTTVKQTSDAARTRAKGLTC